MRAAGTHIRLAGHAGVVVVRAVAVVALPGCACACCVAQAPSRASHMPLIDEPTDVVLAMLRWTLLLLCKAAKAPRQMGASAAKNASERSLSMHLKARRATLALYCPACATNLCFY